MRSPVCKVKDDSQKIFLTFDDGPCPQGTPQVLDLLDEFKAKATFFVIGDKVEKNPNLLKEIIRRGHSVGDHSSDHAYTHYFKKEEHLKTWIKDSWSRLSDKLGEEPIGFRSPAGIVTPPLKNVMEELDIAWVHWNRRFFDSQISLSWMLNFYSYQSGDILLLHDHQNPRRQLNFIENLRNLLQIIQPLEMAAITGDTKFHGS